MQVRTTKVGLKIWHKSRRDTQRMGGEFCAFNFAEGCSLSPEFHSSFPPHWRYSDPQMGEGSVDPTLLARDGPAFVYATTAPKPSRRPRQCSGHIRGGGSRVGSQKLGRTQKPMCFQKIFPGFWKTRNPVYGVRVPCPPPLLPPPEPLPFVWGHCFLGRFPPSSLREFCFAKCCGDAPTRPLL